jgi:3-phosphoshikimate 1-carboxyvinyltransferase
LTIDVMRSFGVKIENDNYEVFTIQGNQNYKPLDTFVEGDHSQMAFWAVAGTIGKAPVIIENASKNTNQGDARIFDIIEEMGGKVEYGTHSIRVSPAQTSNIEINVSEIPDLVPILAVLGTFSDGTMRIVGGERVRLKESDRLKAIATELNKLGAKIEETPDGLIIEGVKHLSGGSVEGWNDHRIVMATAVAAQRCEGPLSIDGWKAINKSYPEFFKDYQNLGGVVNEWNLG